MRCIPVFAIALVASLGGCGTFSFLDDFTTSAPGRASFDGSPAESQMAPERMAAMEVEAPQQTASVARAVPPEAMESVERTAPVFAKPIIPLSQARAAGHVYLFRGVGGRIASLDLDRMASKLNNAGVNASVYNFFEWRGPADEAIARYKREDRKSPIILLGHSAGGDAALAFAYRLKEARVPVSLIVAFDPTRRAGRVPANVDRFVNIYQSLNVFGGGDVSPARDFRGHYASIDLKQYWEVLHVNLVKLEGLQDKVIAKIVHVAMLPSNLEGLTVPIHYVMPRHKPLELFDSGLPIQAEPGDSVRSLAEKYAVPEWAIAQVNGLDGNASFKPGRRVIIPRHLEAAAFGPPEPVTSFLPQAR